ncbi:hypothetical protein [Thiohalophilus sp.]|uniref:hypothetical protein n=1 Tax=Thiohalophilus sp. TaxID=3028392 RepID=UPI002ACE481A|nr:hypothetical protein [Thiohalophilus sp.]MDZ7661896.1 hypothetical protein [Thiohalophilus sp.]MDZ7803763.1 hypothetical protein [Thiohalophilus sp.]
MRHNLYLLLFIVVAASIPMRAALAGTNAPVLAGQPELRQLLQQEMQALKKAMAVLSQALPQGEWRSVAETAGQVHDSFIFQQKLTAKDRKTLHQALPEGFIRQDRAFHQQARKLQHAAESRDAELSLFYYSKMLESCVTCHSKFATHRFPSLAEGGSDHGGH